MVLCLIALPIFALLGIFSVKYRKLTKDALECLFKTATFRKCESGLDDRIKADLTGRVLKLSPLVARFFYKFYKIISWVILILFIWSLYTSAVGVYNYANYGNCNGPDSNDFCVFDPSGKYTGLSEIDIDVQSEIVYPSVEDDDPYIGNKDAELTIIQFGCYACPYTKKAEPIVKEVLEYYEGRVNIQFKTFIIPNHFLSYEAGLAANCGLEQEKYEEYHAALFEQQEVLSEFILEDIARDIGLDVDVFNECMAEEKFKHEVESDALQGIHAGVYGTPTFFIGEHIIVGPKPFKTFKKLIDKELQ